MFSSVQGLLISQLSSQRSATAAACRRLPNRCIPSCNNTKTKCTSTVVQECFYILKIQKAIQIISSKGWNDHCRNKLEDLTFTASLLITLTFYFRNCQVFLGHPILKIQYVLITLVKSQRFKKMQLRHYKFKSRFILFTSSWHQHH